MRYSGIKYCDIANGRGVRTTLFVSGCRNHCEGCFNPDTWDFSSGDPFTDLIEDEVIESLRPHYVDGLTILGGEPLEPENQPAVFQLVTRAKHEFPEKDVWLYTGFTLEGLWERSCRANTPLLDRILGKVDILVDVPSCQPMPSTLNSSCPMWSETSQSPILIGFPSMSCGSSMVS